MEQIGDEDEMHEPISVKEASLVILESKRAQVVDADDDAGMLL